MFIIIILRIIIIIIVIVIISIIIIVTWHKSCFGLMVMGFTRCWEVLGLSPL